MVKKNLGRKTKIVTLISNPEGKIGKIIAHIYIW